MSDTHMDFVPAQERDAIALVQSLGLEGAHKALDAIHAKADAKMKTLCGDDLANLPIGFSGLNYLSEEDLERRYILNLGIGIVHRSSPAEAHARIVARLKKRRAEAKASRKSSLSEAV